MVTRRLVLTEGEKGRHESIAIGPAAPPPVPTPSPGTENTAPGAPAPASGGGMGTRKVLGLVLGGAGVAGVGVGSVFGLMAISKKNQQTTDCGTSATCSAEGHARALDDHSSGITDSTIATVTFIAGGALLAGGAVLFFTGGHASEGAESAWRVVPSVGPSGGEVLVRGAF